MIINQETAGQKQINNEDYNFPTGVYTCRLADVQQIQARTDDERQTPRLIFEFEVVDGQYKGKKTATFVRKNLFAGGGSRNAKPSNLYKLAKSLGCADPMAGFDTTQFIGKLYTVVVKNDSDRAWPESVLPANNAANVPTRQGPPPRKSNAPVMQKYWIDTGDGNETLGTAEAVRAFIFEKGLKAADLMLCPEGGDEWKPAGTFGFENAPIPA
jgi:hypothetical protein